MKLSELWLRECIPLCIDTAELSEKIIMSGLEVTDIKKVSNLYPPIIIGEVVQCHHHSLDHNLYVNKINIGNKHLLSIVNHHNLKYRKNLKVVVAMSGATLANHVNTPKNEFSSVLSEAKLCSFSDLGIANEDHRIIELPADAPIGGDVITYLKLNDNIIDVSIPSNRGDCLSMRGMTRDIAAFNNLKVKQLFTTLQPIKPTIDDIILVNIHSPTACPRYLNRVFKNLNINATTPLWMIEKLRRSGISSVHPIVDITNYIRLELGQPMHAFDLKKIHGNLLIRISKDNETLTTINGKKIILNSNTLVICDKNQIIALAGIIGSKDSAISQKTQDVLLECAFFSPKAILGRTHNYGIYTDSAYYYERGVDPNLQFIAMQRATELLLTVCGGTVGPISDYTHASYLPKPIMIILRRKKLDRVIGYNISEKEVINILIRIGCIINTISINNIWQVIVPSWRFDILIEEDVIKEIIRIYGYNNIPNIPMQTNLIMTPHTESELSLHRVKYLMVDKGYQEAITYSFVNPTIQNLLHPNQSAITLPHPISIDMSVMRLSLWTGLIKTLIYNHNRQQERIRLFESGFCFTPDPTANLGIKQDFMLAGILSGNRYTDHWDLEKNIVDFYDLKGDVESILDLTGTLDKVAFLAEKHSVLHPGQSAAIYLCNERIGVLGTLHPKIAKKLNIKPRILLFELLWNKVSHCVLPKSWDISRFPANRRDICIIVDENIPAGDIIEVCKKRMVNYLVSINVFDVYRGKDIDKGKKSLAISLIFQDMHRTLHEEEIAEAITKCIKELKERFQATLRY